MEAYKKFVRTGVALTALGVAALGGTIGYYMHGEKTTDQAALSLHVPDDCVTALRDNRDRQPDAAVELVDNCKAVDGDDISEVSDLVDNENALHLLGNAGAIVLAAGVISLGLSSPPRRLGVIR